MRSICAQSARNDHNQCIHRKQHDSPFEVQITQRLPTFKTELSPGAWPNSRLIPSMTNRGLLIQLMQPSAIRSAMRYRRRAVCSQSLNIPALDQLAGGPILKSTFVKASNRLKTGARSPFSWSPVLAESMKVAVLLPSKYPTGPRA